MEIPLIVSIRCLVYNHEPYIRQCLDGFVMQKTNFKFEAVVHDDASTDGTAAIIREYAERYPEIIKPIYETENQYSKRDGSLGRIMNEACTGKYIAMCEGDDYWTDPLKLQKQVDFMEENLEYGVCYSKVNRYLQNKEKFIGLFGEKFESFETLLLEGNVIPTLSVVFRRELYTKYIEEINPNSRGWQMGDYPMWLYLAYYSRWHFFDEVTGCYRILQESAAHSKDVEKLVKFARSYYEIRLFFAKKYGLESSKIVLDSQYLWSLLCIYAETHNKCVLEYLRMEYRNSYLPASIRKKFIQLVMRFPIFHYCLSFYKRMK